MRRPTHRSTALKPTTILRIFPRNLHRPPRPWAFFKSMGLLGLGLVLTACQALPPMAESQLDSAGRSAPLVPTPFGANEHLLWDGLRRGMRSAVPQPNVEASWERVETLNETLKPGAGHA